MSRWSCHRRRWNLQEDFFALIYTIIDYNQLQLNTNLHFCVLSSTNAIILLIGFTLHCRARYQMNLYPKFVTVTTPQTISNFVPPSLNPSLNCDSILHLCPSPVSPALPLLSFHGEHGVQARRGQQGDRTYLQRRFSWTHPVHDHIFDAPNLFDNLNFPTMSVLPKRQTFCERF